MYASAPVHQCTSALESFPFGLWSILLLSAVCAQTDHVDLHIVNFKVFRSIG